MRETHRTPHFNRSFFMIFMEITFIVLFGLWFCRTWLNMDPMIIPTPQAPQGSMYEYEMVIRSHAIWDTFKQCGPCFLWNGSLKGGYPAFAEMQGSVFHPFVIFFTLLFGLSNGTKLVLVASFITAGLAQWWIGHTLGLHPLARTWAGILAVTAGTLSSRMALGVVGMVVSAAMATLGIAALLHLVKYRDGRSLVLFAISLACLIVAGQAYVQVGFLLVVPLCVLMLAVDLSTWRIDKILFPIAAAGVLSLLLTAFFLIPVLRIAPQLDKFVDINFILAQSFESFPINFIATDMTYLEGILLKGLPFVEHYGDYIGWIPVLFAILGFRYSTGERSKWFWFFLLGVVLSIFASSGTPLRWLIPFWPSVQSIRFPQWFAGITTPMLLGLAALGMDGALSTRIAIPDWLAKIELKSLPQIKAQASNALLILLLLAPMAWSVKSTVDFSSQWIGSKRANENGPMLDSLPRNSAYWLEIDYWSHFWNLFAAEKGIKLGVAMNPFRLRHRLEPGAEFAIYPGFDQEKESQLIYSYHEFNLYWRHQYKYTYAMVHGEKVPCNAVSRGGYVDVTCDLATNGVLFVMENNFDGWKAWMDDKPVTLFKYQTWLVVPASAGKHQYTFRFFPWDVPLGLAIALAGWAVCLRLWRKNPTW